LIETRIGDEKPKIEAKLRCLSMKKRELNNIYVLPRPYSPKISNAVKIKHKEEQASRDT